MVVYQMQFTMLSTTLKSLYTLHLGQLKQEITLYRNEANIWHTDRNILNSAGNLCLHLVGNLNTYIGAQFGNTGYVRNRPEEFSLKNIPRYELINKIDATIEMIEMVVGLITEEQFNSEYPQVVLDGKLVSTEYFLVHLATHLSYHLGQVNYHRRLLDY